MKKIFFNFLMFLTFFALVTGCTGKRLGPRETLGQGENLAVDIVELNLREELRITGWSLSAKRMVTMYPALMVDQNKNGVLLIFREKIFEALQKREIRVAPGAPIKLFIGIAQGSTSVGLIGSQMRCLAAEVKIVEEGQLFFRFMSVVFGPYEIYHLPITDYQGLTEKLAEDSANDIVVKLREKPADRKEGEI